MCAYKSKQIIVTLGNRSKVLKHKETLCKVEILLLVERHCWHIINYIPWNSPLNSAIVFEECESNDAVTHF